MDLQSKLKKLYPGYKVKPVVLLGRVLDVFKSFFQIGKFGQSRLFLSLVFLVGLALDSHEYKAALHYRNLWYNKTPSLPNN